METGNLEKVRIKAFKDKEMKQAIPEGEFVLPVNPESFTRSFKIQKDKTQGKGKQGAELKFKYTPPQEFKLDFVLDGTETIEGYESTLIGMPVAEQIDNLLNVIYLIDGESHKPHFLKIFWGKYDVFYCMLTSADVNYTLFHSNGNPLRAKLSCSFTQFQESKREAALVGRNSPDLTHRFTLVEGETLVYRSNDVYASDDFYRQVAAFNGLTSFRNVPTGTLINYPPVKKIDA